MVVLVEPEKLRLCGHFWRVLHWTEPMGKLQGKLSGVKVDAGEPALNRQLHFYIKELQKEA